MNRVFNLTFLILAFFFILHAAVGFRTIDSLSPTNDETIYLASGYSQLMTGDYRMNPDHPPFAAMWAAVPLLFLGPPLPLNHPLWENLKADLTPQYIFADLFFYNGQIDPDTMLKAGRMMTLLLSLFLGLVIYLWARALASPGAGVLALFLWGFSSAFVGHGTLATNDMAITLFSCMAFYFFWRWQTKAAVENNFRVHLALATGASLGLALASKHSALVLLPVMGVLIGRLWWHKRTDASARLSVLKQAALAAAACALVLLAVYQFASIGSYWASIRHLVGSVSSGHRSFFLGRHSDTGWLAYFPVAFILKTPLPFVLLFFLALLHRRAWNKERFYFLLLPALVFFLASCLSKKQIGHRYILPVYPFLTVWIAAFYPSLTRVAHKTVVFLLLAWYALVFARAHPWHISYFNELVGSPDNGYHYLTDSNVDWGQGVKALGTYLSEHDIRKIYLCYCGVSDPHYYGIDYIPLYSVNDLHSVYITNRRLGYDTDPVMPPEAEQHAWFAISASNLQSTYYEDKKLFSWLKEIPYEAVIARSIILYDLTKYPGQYQRLREALTNDPALWARGFELQKAGLLDEAIVCYKNYLHRNPHNPQVWFNMAYAYMDRGSLREAIDGFSAVVRLRPEYGEPHLYLSQCYKKLGEAKRAEKHRKLYEKSSALTNPA